MKLQTFACLVLLLLVGAFASAQQTPSAANAVRSPSLVDWPQFHFDPGLSGYNPFETVIGPSNVGNVTLKWTYTPPEGQILTGPPVVSNGVMYFGQGFNGFDNSPFELYALNADTGAFLWKHETEPIFGSPAVANGMVYVIDADYLSALNADTGALIWQYDVPGQGQYGSPTVVNNVVYFTSSFPSGNVYALNATTGSLLWTYPLAGGTPASPAVVDGLLYISAGPSIVYALNATSGALVWKKQFGSNIGPSATLGGTQGGQSVANGVLYVAVVRTGQKYDLYALNASTGAFLWRTSLGVMLFGETPAVANGKVYIGASGQLYALNATTGAVLWATPGGENSPIVANGVVYSGNWGQGSEDVDQEFANILAFDAGTGALLWHHKTDLGYEYGGLFPTPVVVNGTIYGTNISADKNQVAAWSLPN
jgi:outer membrane protein assembly factor BamB